MDIAGYIKNHPYATGTIVIVGGLIFILIVRGGSSSSTTTSGTSVTGPTDAQYASSAAVQQAQINAQSQVGVANAQADVAKAQAAAAVQVAQIGAGTQLNSDNKLAEVMMAAIQSEQAIKSQAITAANKLPENTRSESSAAITSIVTGQNTSSVSLNRGETTTKSNSSSNEAASIVGSVGSFFSKIFSDQRLKENIKLLGYDANGREVYEYNYKGSTRKHRGYMAQSIMRSEPEKVSLDPATGYMMLPADIYS